jgi:tRNA 2-selenouridine synthase
MRQHGQCLVLQTDDEARVQLLLREYAFFSDEPGRFCELLEGLVALRGHASVERWQAQARAGQWAEVFRELMLQHYDPMYTASLQRSYAKLAEAPRVELASADAPALRACAQTLVAALQNGRPT